MRNPNHQFDHIFAFDRGGRKAYDALSNASVRIYQKGRVPAAVNFAVGQLDYRQVRITSNPELPAKLTVSESTSVIYEFHSPEKAIVERELENLDTRYVDEIWAPSEWAVEFVKSLTPARMHLNIRAVKNPVDSDNFVESGPVAPLANHKKIPVSWIGRLENSQKNYLDFLRILKGLPGNYFGVVVFSLESSPDRLERFLGEAAMLGVSDRIRLYSNVPQTEVAAIHRAVRDAGGVFLSTALSESFGYAVLEAALCGCPVVAYDVGPLRDHLSDKIHLVDVGDILNSKRIIQNISG